MPPSKAPRRPRRQPPPATLDPRRAHWSSARIARLRSWLFPAEAGARHQRDRWLAILFLALSVVIVARAARKQGGVLETNQGFGARFLAREDPWLDRASGERVHGPYPPSLSLVAAPLALLEPRPARVLWALAQVGALLLTYRLLKRRAERTWPALERDAPALFALAVLLASRFLLRDTAGGGGNILFGTLAFLALELSFSGRPAPAGAALGLSLALKPNLAPLLLFLAAAGRRDGGPARHAATLAWSLVFGSVFFWLPAVHFGWQAYLELAQRWLHDVTAYAALHDPSQPSAVPSGLPVAATTMNQCLREAILRAFRFAAGDPLPTASAAAAAWLARATSLALVLGSLWLAHRARAAADRRAEWLSAMAFLPLALLVSPVTWKAHHAVLLPVFFGLACCALDPSRPRRGLGWFLVAYWVICDLASEEVIGSAGKELLQGASVVTWMDLALLVKLAQLIVPALRDPPGSSRTGVA